MDLHLHAYLQNLLETAHHTKNIPAPLADKMIADLRIQLEQRLMTGLLDKLSEADQQEYANLIETDPNQSDVITFLNQRIPEAAQLTAQILLQFEQDYIATINYQPKP